MLHDVTYALTQLGENKLLTSVVPVLLGAGLLSWLFKIRDRRIAVRDETLRFVGETADLLNLALSAVFRAIWLQSVERLDVADKGIAGLFEHRLSTRARSIVLLGTQDFSKEYEGIVWQLRETVDEFRLAAQSLPALETSHIGKRTLPLPPPWNGLHQNAKETWDRAAALVTAGIESAIHGKTARIDVHPPKATTMSPLRNE